MNTFTIVTNEDGVYRKAKVDTEVGFTQVLKDLYTAIINNKKVVFTELSIKKNK